MTQTASAPLIYNLHPLLAGPIAGWGAHFPRIRAMGFDWLYVNAYFAAGASGSLYAIADPLELHARVRGEANGPAADLERRLTADAAAEGLRVMTDLVIPHAARDGRLVDSHPDWFRRRPDGDLAMPALANPGAPHHPRHMRDLAEIDFRDQSRWPAMLDHFAGIALHRLGLGVAGFRCSAAYKVPPAFWARLIARIRADHPDAVFLAAALGCPFEQVLRLAGCGFDLVFDSACWWDFRDSWFLDQYEQLRRVAPTVSFPEDHNTPRLAARAPSADPETLARLYRSRYLATLALGSGAMMPMGFEYALRTPLDPVQSDPAHWAEAAQGPAVDLSDFIAEANAAKRSLPPLVRPGPQRAVSAPGGRVLGVLRFDRESPAVAGHATLFALNSDVGQPDPLSLSGALTGAGGRFDRFADATPGTAAIDVDGETPLTLEPLEARILAATAATTRPAAPAADPAASLERLEALAARRVAIEKVTPELDGGRFPVKRIVGDVLTVEADIFADGHDKIAARILYRRCEEEAWRSAPMALVDNDRWAGQFALTRNTRYVYTVEAWRDLFESWRVEIGKKHGAGLAVSLELSEGVHLLRDAAAATDGPTRAALDALIAEIEARPGDDGFHLARLLAQETAALVRRAGLRADVSRYERELAVIVDRTAAAFASWYELFPRSQSDDPSRHGTFDDVIAKLPYVRDMGFDVLYFPPIHPIGRKNRKGRNNTLTPQPGDPGSPYAIGSEDGGHDALHPELGDFDDFRRLVDAAHDHGLEIAIDFAIQCSPDHPWIRQHPGWFDWREDGSIRYAENPPKKYEDIVNVSFYREEALPDLWIALRDVVLFWIGHGVKTFRVDNPHTKPLPFWEWMIREVQDQHPDAVFLAEAFTRPKMMKRLAKVGFTQSYSYFTWRNEKAELTEYLTELTRDEPREHMRPNFFVNTPDINPVYLQTGGRAAFQVRAVLAATLSTLWGVYSGFELCEARPVPGKEEYLDSEKYEIKAWDWDRPGNIRRLITQLNRIRRANPALWQFADLEFLPAHDENVLVYVKMTPGADNAVLVAVNLDPHAAHGAQFELPLWRFGLDDGATIAVEDLTTGGRFSWTGKVQHVWLDPSHAPFAIWRLVPPGHAGAGPVG